LKRQENLVTGRMACDPQFNRRDTGKFMGGSAILAASGSVGLAAAGSAATTVDASQRAAPGFWPTARVL